MHCNPKRCKNRGRARMLTPYPGACRLQRFPHALERRRPRHPNPERSRSGIREVAVANVYWETRKHPGFSDFVSSLADLPGLIQKLIILSEQRRSKPLQRTGFQFGPSVAMHLSSSGDPSAPASLSCQPSECALEPNFRLRFPPRMGLTTIRAARGIGTSAWSGPWDRQPWAR